MTKMKFSGPLWMRLSSFVAINKIGIATYVRHALGRRIEPTWDANLETGIRFWRHQFTLAMRQPDIARGRQILDSLQTETDNIYEVSVEPCEQRKGHWYVPKTRRSDATLLYLHGGGYAFHGAMSKRFAAMLAHHCGARLFAPNYRLTTNDRYDLVQGWMALRFGEWLDPKGRYGRAALSPIAQDYKGLAPIYLQAGAREVLRDMIRDFATAQAEHGADVLLDIWSDMPHDFQAFDIEKQSSTEALSRICSAVLYHVDKRGSFAQGPNTVVAHGAFTRR
jgi:acetyl esterase/lipase